MQAQNPCVVGEKMGCLCLCVCVCRVERWNELSPHETCGGCGDGWKDSLISCCERPMTFEEGGEDCIYYKEFSVLFNYLELVMGSLAGPHR